MSTAKKKTADKHVGLIYQKLVNEYASRHPHAGVDVKRYNSVSVRVRIIDPSFSGCSRTARESLVWTVLDNLPAETVAEISLLILLTPEEAKTSLMNLEFEEPTPSRF